MVQKNQNWDKVLGIFFEHSSKSFKVREISKIIKIPSSTVQRYLEKLKVINFITKDNRANINSYFKFRKSFFIIDKIFKSGLINYLEENLKSSVIIIFGSARKGEYEKESDLDFFVESNIKKDLDLQKFEKKINHKIQLFVEKDINKLPNDLLNSVINGIKLSGYLKIK